MTIEEVQKVGSPDSWEVGSLLTFEQGLQLDSIKTHNWTIIRCSAITGDNLSDGLEWVVRDAKDKLFLY